MLLQQGGQFVDGRKDIPECPFWGSLSLSDKLVASIQREENDRLNAISWIASTRFGGYQFPEPILKITRFN